MRRTPRLLAAIPLRAVLIVLLLSGFGLWQCVDGMMASPATTTTMPHRPAAGLATASPPATDEPQHDSGMAGMCITVLACLAAVLMHLRMPVRLIAILRLIVSRLVRPAGIAVPGPALVALCVSRT